MVDNRFFAESNVAIFCTADDGYLIPSVIALYAIQRFHPKAGYFIFGTFSEHDKALRLFEKFNIRFLDYPHADIFADSVNSVNQKTRWPRQSFWKLTAAQQLSAAGYEHSCCVDGDVLCVNPIDFSETFNSEWAFAAVIKKDGLINSGVLFQNHRFLAEIEFSRFIMDLYKGTHTCRHGGCSGFCREKGDQDLLELAVNERNIPWKVLPTQYNHLLAYPYSQYEKLNTLVLDSVDECTFLHIMLKPWLNHQAVPSLYPQLQKGFQLWKEVAEEILPGLDEFNH